MRGFKRRCLDFWWDCGALGLWWFSVIAIFLALLLAFGVYGWLLGVWGWFFPLFWAAAIAFILRDRAKRIKRGIQIGEARARETIEWLERDYNG